MISIGFLVQKAQENFVGKMSGLSIFVFLHFTKLSSCASQKMSEILD